MRASEIQPRKLVIFDIDDTLVHTQTKVHVVKGGRVVNSLNSHDFTHYKLQPGESFDFENFRNAHDFFHNSKPIIPMMNQLKKDIATGNKVVMVTARADFDDRELFLDTFRKYGVDMNRVHVYRAGNMSNKIQTEEKKKIIIRDLLNKGQYTKAIMYDDALPNLESFVELKDEYPRTKFYAWHVSLEGDASEYNRTNESLDEACWKGYKQLGMKKKGKRTVPNCVPVKEAQDEYEIRNYSKLDNILSKLCEMVVKGQDSDKDYGMVAAAVVDPDNQIVARLNRPGNDGKRIHAEHAAMEDYTNKYGPIPEGSIIITTLSPCNEHMDERDGPSCTSIINNSTVKKVYCGYMDPTQDDDTRQFNLMETADKGLRTRCKQFADTFLDHVHEGLMGLLTKSAAKSVAKKPSTSLADIRAASQQTQDLLPPPHIRMYLHRIKDAKEKGIAPQFSASEYRELEQWVAQQKIHSNLPENFADGRNPQDKGDSKRHGINTKASVTSLRKTAKQGGRKGQLAHWLANMKAGRAK